MNISSNIGIPFLFTLLIVVVSFSIRFIKSSKWFLNFNLHYILDMFIEGVILSSFFILFQLIFKTIDKSYHVPIIYAGAIIIALTRNTFVALFYIPLTLVYEVLINKYDPSIFGALIITLIVMILNEILIAFSIKWRNVYMLIVIALLSLSTFIFTIFFSKASNVIIYSNTLLFGLTILLPLGLMMWIANVSISANILNDKIYYYYGNYYRSGFWKIPLFEKIKEEKISKGIFVLFNINFSESSPEERDEVKKTILKAIENRTQDKDPLLFHFEANTYGIFIKTLSKINLVNSIKNNYLNKRPNGDSFSYVEKLLNNLAATYKTRNRKLVKVKIKAGAIVYGQQESSLNNLERYALYSLRTNSGKGSTINIFDYKLFRIRLNENEKIRALDYQIVLEDYVNTFLPIIDTSTHIVKWNYLLTKNLNGFINEKTYDYVRALNVEDLFKRYFATDALRKIKDKNIKVIIPYSIKYLLYSFDVNEFKKTLNKNNVLIDNIALSFWITDKSKISEIRYISAVLDEYGIKYVFEGQLWKIKKIIDELNPIMCINWFPEKTFEINNLINISKSIDTEKKLILFSNNKQNIIPFKIGEKISI